MKRYFLFALFILGGTNVLAQSPLSFNYQAVVRNVSGSIVSNQPIGMRVSIIKGSTSGTLSYVETHRDTSSQNGLIDISIGMGTPITGRFSDINWSQGPYFIKTETDVTGGSNYQLVGTIQLMSVPYSLFSNDVLSDLSGDTLSIGKKRYLIPGIKSIGTNDLQIGDPYGGGIVAYIYQPGDPGYDPNVKHGLISSKIDQTINSTSPYYSGTGCMWQLGTYVASQQTTVFDSTGSNGKLLGTGLSNTQKIIQVSQRTGRPFAAAEFAVSCREGGFTDWFLPSEDELVKLYVNRVKIGGFFAGWYWSSTERNNAYAGAIDFSNGYLDQGYKGPGGTPYKVRAIRYF